MKLSDVKIAYKGLALVAIPLATNLFFLSVLGILLHQSEVEGEHESHSKQVQTTTNRLGRCFFQEVSVVSSLFLLHSRAAVAGFEALNEENQSLVRTLTELAAGTRELEAAVTKFKATNARAMELFQTLYEASQDIHPSTFLHIGGIRDELESVTRTMARDLGEIDKVVLELDKQRSAPQASTWRNIMAVLIYVGFVISMIVSFVLARLFSKEITSRLQQVIENTQRLPRNEPLAPKMTGADEITALDGTFHDMAAALKQAERMRRDFVAMLTHDLRNPLTSIQLLLEVVAEEQPRIARAQGEVERLLTMINDLLDIEQVETGRIALNKEAVSIDSLVGRALDSLQELAKSKRITFQKDCQNVEAFADGLRLLRVLVNLLANAIRYSPAGGTITASCKEEDNFVVVAIADEGPGISEAEQAQLFQTYKQLGRSADRGGSGLGLAICRAIIESHGGQIGVQSQVGQGSSFWFRIPVSISASAETEAGGAAAG